MVGRTGEGRVGTPCHYEVCLSRAAKLAKFGPQAGDGRDVVSSWGELAGSGSAIAISGVDQAQWVAPVSGVRLVGQDSTQEQKPRPRVSLAGSGCVTHLLNIRLFLQGFWPDHQPPCVEDHYCPTPRSRKVEGLGQAAAAAILVASAAGFGGASYWDGIIISGSSQDAVLANAIGNPLERKAVISCISDYHRVCDHREPCPVHGTPTVTRQSIGW